MTKAQVIDLVYINLGGGKVSQDNAVKRHEIAVYLDTALGTALKSALFASKSTARGERSQGMLFESSIPEGYYTTFEGTPTYDSARASYSMTLPKAIVMEHGWGVRNPRAKKNPVADFVRLPNPSAMAGSESVFSGVYSYWTEEIDDATVIFFNNLPAPICPMLVSVISAPSSLDDDDEIKLPQDVVDAAVRLAVQFFEPQAGRRADLRQDDKAPNEQ